MDLNYLNQEIYHLSSSYKGIDESNLYKTDMEISKSKIKPKEEEPSKNELHGFSLLSYISKKTISNGK